MQQPNKDVRGKELRIESESHCVKLMTGFKLMQVNRKNFKQTQADRQVEEVLQKEKRDRERAKP